MKTTSLPRLTPPELERRFRELLPHLTAAVVDRLLGTFSELKLDRLESPRTGLIMITAEDSFATPFHLGEMLVSVAEVEFDEIRGQATVMGDCPRKAVLAAIVNVVCRSQQAQELLEPFRTELTAAEEEVLREQERERQLVAATRVCFENMAKENG